MNLGRFQPGQILPIGVTTVDGTGTPTWPDTAPVATVKDAGNNVIWTGKVALDPDTPYRFSSALFLGIPYSLGTYSVGYEWSVGVYNGTATDTFDVISGGDVGGRIIAMYAYDRPEARYVVAQLTSGNIVQGRNPRL